MTPLTTSPVYRGQRSSSRTWTSTISDVRIGQLDERVDLFLEGRAQHDRDFPGHPEMAEGVGPVGVGLDVEDDVAVRRLRPFLADEADHRQAVEELLAAGSRRPRIP